MRVCGRWIGKVWCVGLLAFWLAGCSDAATKVSSVKTDIVTDIPSSQLDVAVDAQDAAGGDVDTVGAPDQLAPDGLALDTLTDTAGDTASDGQTPTDGVDMGDVALTDAIDDAQPTDAEATDATENDAEQGDTTALDVSLDAKTDTQVGDWSVACYFCHGDVAHKNPAPPVDLQGDTDTAVPAVGAHQSHLGTADWHHQVGCTECHAVPSQPFDPIVPTHMNGKTDFFWGPLAQNGAYDKGASHTCASTYCHGSTLLADAEGKTSIRIPQWNKVDGSQKSCGAACHTTPPGGTHAKDSACGKCHTSVISSFDAATGTAVWADADKHINGKVDVDVNCTTCHGDKAKNTPWPPRGTKGEMLTTDPAVGAHVQHLGKSTWHRGGKCDDCHAVPSLPIHSNGTVDFDWSDVATAKNSKPQFDSEKITCSGVYCHGGALQGPKDGGTVKHEPIWNQVDGSFSACGTTCHTNPPGGTHPQNDACKSCHGLVISSYDPTAKTATWAKAAAHIDGIVQLSDLTCTSCHGDPATQNPAPPKGLKGELQTTDAAVGAHQKHLGKSDWHREGQCADCHTVPQQLVHANGLVEFTWGAVATAMGAQPSFDTATLTCASAYCHTTKEPAAKAGGTVLHAPLWNQVDGSQAKCGASCHTNPPGGSHPKGQFCNTCHGSVIAGYDAGTQTATWVNAALHIDGKIQVGDLTCTSCHGDVATSNPMPPWGTKGETQPSQAAVGAHSKHVGTSDWHRDGLCSDCHILPSSTAHSNGVVDLAWGAVATAKGALPAFDPTSVTCATVYCHGAAMGPAKVGGTVLPTPVWNVVDGTYDSCGASCHTNPPGGKHPNSTACEMCHGTVIASYSNGAATWKNRTLHVDGTVQVANLTCTSCHGDATTGSAAPPKGTSGETQTSQLAVGAHSIHLAQSDWHRDGQCTDCHTVPDSNNHTNGVVEMTWGPLAKTGTAAPSFDASNATCSGVYCHGATLPPAKAGGTTKTTPIWTKVDGTYNACGASCHTNAPGGLHPASQACEMCHDTVISSYDPATGNATWKDKSKHIDGNVDVKTLTCTSCHGDAASNNPAPPLGTKGETLTSQAAVGAHAQHLGASTWHRDGTCDDCHATPDSVTHTNGVVDFVWGAVATAAGATPAFDGGTVTCNTVYCHGTTLPPAKAGGVTKTAPIWNKVDGTFDSCGASCHTNPPGGAHPQSSACAMCHGDVIAGFDVVTQTATWKDRTRHVDGKMDVATLTCTSCHGDTLANNPAPPLGTKGETLTTQAAVGAHAQHLAASTWHRDGQCGDCHATPASLTHTNGVVDFAWGPVAAASGATPYFSPDTVTCSGAYCHGSTLAPAKTGGTVLPTPIWTKVDGTYDSCGASCHTNPPGGTHPQSTACAMCHSDVIAGYDAATTKATWKDKSLHVDGKVELTTLTCTSCHGDAASNNPAPPLGTHGETQTSQAAVGAHAQHLGTSTWHRDGQCSDCHATPGSTTHTNGVVDFAWGAVATAAGAAPAFDAGTVTCNTVYCHGTTLQPAKAGGTTQTAPIWTKVDGTYASCGASCHTNPPGGSHPQSTACQMCHGDVIASFDTVAQTATWKDRTLHVDGTVELKALTCTSCHGDAASNNPAPPLGTHGETLTSQAAVGAHAQHLATATWHRDVQCGDCHATPSSMMHTNSVVDFAWGVVATASGAAPTFDAATVTCNTVYCHGATLFPAKVGGTTKTAPIWTQVDGTFKSCGASCHTTPPGGSHPQSTACQQCHTAVIAGFDPVTQTATWTDRTLHVNGKVELYDLNCTSCHGDKVAGDPAPPLGTKGETLTTQAAVGAHQKHLTASAWHRAGQCADCHNAPSSMLHTNGIVDFAWGVLATTAGATPSFDAATVTCNTVYCHGSTLLPAKTGGTLKQQPVWNQVDGTFASCGASCHTNPPGGTHTASTACQMCHGEVIASYDAAGASATWVDAARHVDGKVDVTSLTCTSCHGDKATNDPAPPLGTKGETLTSQAAVGAHQKHLGASAWHRAGQCADCHAAPAAILHTNGVVDFAWGAVATTAGATPTFDAATVTCNTVYCHGTTLPPAKAGGTVKQQPVWTQVDGTFESCGASCHTNPPGGAHPQSTACQLCHTDVIAGYDAATQTATWQDATRHVDGKIDVVTLTCTSCHGNTATNSPAPPLGTQGETQSSQAAVGAHAQHLITNSSWHRDGQCGDCHATPASTTHTNGVVDFAWGVVATASGSAPSFDAGTVTCNSVYCHGGTLAPAKAGGTVQHTPIWNKVDGSFAACGTTCHTNPPGGTHPQRTDCAKCHGAVLSSYDPATHAATWVAPWLHVDGKVDVATLTCTTCHGDAATNNPAPPLGNNGETETTEAAVGAHAQHLTKTNWHRDGQCSDCHTVPGSVMHWNGVVDFTWGAVATAAGATPSFDGATLTCATAYCHGATLLGPNSGGAVKRTPKWTQVDGTYDSCGASCHTNPPGGTHVQSTACQMCHSDVISAYTPGSPPAIAWNNGSLHINGVVDVKTLTCTSCHGDAATNNPAPPLGTKGETATTQPAVGAHAQHLGTSTWHRDGQCADCHATPASTLHTNNVIDFAWGAVPSASGAAPTFDAGTVTCSSVYCHGTTLQPAKTGGATKTAPIWTKVDGTYDSCGASCHTNPPGGTHPVSTACAMCHGDVIASFDPATQTATWTDRTRHVDGTLDLKTLTCTSCHGDAPTNNPAPPLGTKGETLTTQAAVGAHAQHLGTSTWHRDGQCADCHATPASTLHTNSVIDFAWGAVSTSSGATPVFNVGTVTCNSVYCHGSTLLPAKAGGTTKTAPIWTQVDGTYDSCGASCHTNPPGGSHTTNTACASCHGDVIASFDSTTQTATWKDRTRHVNGTVDVANLTCTSCHGDAATNNPAPPLGTKGETLTTQAAVGAHAQHLGTSSWHRDGQCSDCHATPASTLHSDGTVNFAWGALPTSAGATPTFDVPTVTCNSVYCHGSTLLPAKTGGATKTAPIWNVVNGTYDSCGASCHTNPPGGTHSTSAACAMCHGDVIASFDPTTQTATWKDRTRHVNGTIDVSTLTCTGCHGDAPTNNPAPPLGTKGETLTSQAAVGAHAQHLGTSTWHRDGQCADCHATPASTTHTNGVVDFAWGTVAAASGAAPAFDVGTVTCNSVYCHGTTLLPAKAGGVTKTAPIWNKVDGTYDSCGASCHTNPPGGTHPQSTACQMCHTAVISAFDATTQTATWTDRTLHVDGQVQIYDLTCTSCHGNAATNNPAPPLGPNGETLTTQAAVGAHAQHLGTSAWHRDGQCGDCHATPASTMHSNGVIDFAWGAVSTSAGAAPAFDVPTVTCNSVYCHGSTLLPAKAGGVTKTAPIWTTVDGTYDSCGASCHTNPPGGTHSTSTGCQMCHGDVIANFDPATQTATWKDRTLHVNGTVDVTALNCTSCHGDPTIANPAPPRGTKGETLTSQAAVGAHSQHLGTSSWHRDGQCADCHATPGSTLHSNGTVDFAWGAVPTSGGATPTFDGPTVTCNSVYCHGSTLLPAKAGGATKTAPIWNVVNGTYDSCGASCHTNPPGGTHSTSTACTMCHGDVIASFDPATQTATWKDRTLHVNGTIDVSTLTCTTCHGDAPTNNPAPPLGTKGETLTSQAAVGAHAQHLGTSTWHRDGQCADCHATPASTLHTNGVVDFAWGAVATSAGATPAFDVPTVTCNTVYCHGSTLLPAKAGGATKTAPVWDVVNGTYDSCGASCHTNPPGGSHPTSTGCTMCHGDVIASFDPATQAATWKDRTRHVNGTVDVANLTCTTCHGDAPTNNPAPPLGTKGETLTSQAAVGAHAQHLGTSTWHRDGQCADCHATPASTTHTNGIVDFAWGLVATSSGATPAFNGSTVTCSSVYCHGSTLLPAKTGGTTKTAPIWNKVDGTYDSCGASCHTNPPGGSHPQSTACQMCHTAVISAFDPATQTATWADRTLHVDGQVQIYDLTCTSCHGDKLTNNPAPPLGSNGETLTTQPAVGAHQNHLTTSTWHRTVLCGDCHATPASTLHTNGVVDFAWGAVATSQGATPAFDAGTVTCNTVYCHGSTLFPAKVGGTTKTSPIWNQVDGTFESCGASCHTNPPGGAHTTSTACQMCHGAVITSFDPATQTAAWTDPSRHIDGNVDVSNLTCTSCHGDAATANPAPPQGTKGETLTTQAAVGAHAQHLATSTWHRNGLCSDCHATPGSTAHANGVVDFAWGAIATAAGAVPAFDAVTVTCNTVYCHGTTLPAAVSGGTTAKAPLWNKVDGTYDSCGASCHTNPPGGTHINRTDCATCHDAVLASYTPGAPPTMTWANAQLHIDGIVQVKPLGCLDCHQLGMVAGEAGVTANYHHVLGTDAVYSDPGKTTVTYPSDATGRTCVQCHVDHQVFRSDKNPLNTLGLASNLRAAISVVPGLAPVAAGEVGGFWNEDAEPTFAAGGLCLSCHTTAQTKNTTGQKSDGTTATVALSKTDFLASAHGYAGPVGSFANDASGKTFGTVCVKCHNSDATPDYQNGTYQFQLHASADRRLRAPMGGTPGDNAEEKFCFRCHSQTVDPIGGATKSAVGLDYYGVATMWGPAEGVYQAFTGQPALPTSTTNTVYFKPTAQENPSAPMPSGPISDTGTTFATGALFLRDSGATAPVEPMPNVYQLASGTYDTTTLRLRPMTPQMGATTETVTVNTVNAAGVTYERMGLFVSPPIATPFTWNTNATLTLAMRAIESNANNNCNVRFRVYRWAVADTGTALTAITDGTEIPAALVTDGSTFNANTTTAVTFAAGDKIVIEIESRKNSPTNTGTCTYTWGGGTEDSRLILPATTATTLPEFTATSPTIGGTWTARSMSPSTATAANESIGAAGTVATGSQLWQRATFVTPPLTTAVSMPAASWTLSPYLSESNAAANAFLRYRIYSWNANNTMGTVLVPWSTYSVEMGTTSAAPVITTPVGATASLAIGDKIAIDVEIETVAVLASASYTLQVSFGATAPSTLVAPATMTFNYAQTAKAKASFHNVSGYSGLHRPYVSATDPGSENQAYINANKHIECEDCHDVHAAGNTPHTAGTNAVTTTSPVYGATGEVPTLSATNWTAPTAYTWTAQVAAEYQLCFKCHSGANTNLAAWGGKWADNVAVDEWMDVGLAFSTANGSYHPVVGALPATDPGANGSSRLAAAQLCASTAQTGCSASSQSWTPGKTMYCSDCHGNDAALPAAQGPHGSSVNYILRGPNVYWPKNAAGALYTLSSTVSTRNGLFCNNCHPDVRSTGNNVHTEGNHSNAACVSCHIRVPHGGKLSRLIADCDGATPAREFVTGTPGCGPSGNGSNGQAVLKSFTKSATANYSESACQTACTTHHNTAGTENW